MAATELPPMTAMVVLSSGSMTVESGGMADTVRVLRFGLLRFGWRLGLVWNERGENRADENAISVYFLSLRPATE